MSNVVRGPTHRGAQPQWTGGNHPVGKLYPGDKSGSAADNPGASTGGLANASDRKGYTVLGKSPVQDDRQPYPGQDKHENKGIDIDFDHDGSYTGGGDNGRAT